jgi:VWFA-related protein
MQPAFPVTRLRWVIPVVAACALSFGSAPPSAAPATDTRTISLYATVETDGKLVAGLTAENFRLYEDGQPREFRLVECETPITIALLMEYGETTGLYWSDLRNAVWGFHQAAPEGNWYALATFSDSVKVEQDFTKVKGKILSAFGGLYEPTWGTLRTYDALYEMLETMDRLPGRRVLIFVGSGLNEFSSHRRDDVQSKVEKGNVVIYAIGAGSWLRGSYEPYLTDMERMDLLQADTFLRMLSARSGGEAWFPLFETAYRDVMRGIMQSLENQYRLVYESPLSPDDKFHKIKLEAFQLTDDRRKDLRVRVREGWRF